MRISRYPDFQYVVSGDIKNGNVVDCCLPSIIVVLYDVSVLNPPGSAAMGGASLIILCGIRGQESGGKPGV